MSQNHDSSSSWLYDLNNSSHHWVWLTDRPNLCDFRTASYSTYVSVTRKLPFDLIFKIYVELWMRHSVVEMHRVSCGSTPLWRQAQNFVRADLFKWIGIRNSSYSLVCTWSFLLHCLALVCRVSCKLRLSLETAKVLSFRLFYTTAYALTLGSMTFSTTRSELDGKDATKVDVEATSTPDHPRNADRLARRLSARQVQMIAIGG